MNINGRTANHPIPLPRLALAVAQKGCNQYELARALKTKQGNISRQLKSGKWPIHRDVFDRWVAFLFDPSAKVPPARRAPVKARRVKR